MLLSCVLGGKLRSGRLRVMEVEIL